MKLQTHTAESSIIRSHPGSLRIAWEVPFYQKSIRDWNPASVLALPNFVIEKADFLLENASIHTLVATITVSVSPHASLIGDPVIINMNPVVHPFVLSHKSSHQWELHTTGKPKLDFETVSLYSLVLYAKDDQGATASQTMIIQIADVNEPPIFIGSLAQEDQATEIYIQEDTALGTIIYRAVAKDPEDAVLEYFISPEGSGFTIDSVGTISTATVFDFESEARSLFSTENSLSNTTSVNSTLHNKVDITLNEEIPIGTTVGICQATDEDNLGDLTFQLEPQNIHFAVDKEHGIVVTAGRLDVERAGFAHVQSFTIKACDQDQRCVKISVTAYIQGINDNKPFCDQYLIRYTGVEVIKKDTIVAKLLCHDLDEPPDTIHYAPGLGPIGAGQLFKQVPNAENFIQVAKELDYENPEIIAAGHIYEMKISVFDDLHSSHTVTVTVIIEIAPANDFSPVFEVSHYSFSVPETSGAFYKVGKVTAIDEDYPSCVRYKITNGDVQIIQKFWIHPLSGMIELTTQPDFETVKQYNLTVEGVDCDKFHPRTATTVVTVNIEDENDEAPVCTPSLYQAVILDSVVAGTNINGFSLNCHDRDSQDFEMRFEMVSGNEKQHFGFDPTRGSSSPKLIVKNPFNFESGAERQWRFHLVVHIIDDNLKYSKATNPRTGTAIIDIYVTRANTPPPPTTNFEQRKGLTIMYTAINTYKSSDWYIPFIFTLMAVFFAALVSWMCFLLWRYGNTIECCQKAKDVSKAKLKYVVYHS
ncbi:cadherin-related family member 3-like [Sorex araneus]|uniref:cadherin-related family member 3-like n=1 Tax=Sorex araneus TaxID=42254 RepID=UPI0024336881|nr:cadherin-related family member 3-like [Sorex araneus]